MIGGPIEEIGLDGRAFTVAGDGDAPRKLGGFENESQPNGNATARQIKTRVAWSVTGIPLVIDDDNGDHEFIQNLADLKRDFPIYITYASNVTYQGIGQIQGEVAFANQSTTAPMNLGGPGKLTQQ